MSSKIIGKPMARPRPKGYTSSTTTTATSTTTTSSAETQLQHLKPSSELMTYYQKKIQRLNKENSEMQERMEECMSLCDMSIQLEQELIQRNSDISTLQEATSDLQVYLYQEREQSLKLYAENDRLRLREIEDRKKIDLLLTLSGCSEREVRIFLSTSEHGLCVPQKLPARLHKYKNRLNVISKQTCNCCKCGSTSSTFEEPIGKGVNLEAQMLEAQLEEQTCLARTRIETLLKDRELIQKEHKFDRDRLQSHISSLVSRLKLTQDKLCISTSEFLTMQEDYRNKETKWMEQKEQMSQKLAIFKRELGESYPSTLGYTISGSGLRKSLRSTSTSTEFSSLKEQLQEQNSLLILYRNQSSLLEQELSKVKAQLENSKCLLRDQAKKLTAQVSHFKTKFNTLDRRRMLEAEGFQNDMKMLRSRINDMEKNFHKIVRAQTLAKVSSVTEKEIKMIASIAQDIRTTATLIKDGMKAMKRQMHEIESNLNSE